jgi:hypothetical protein
MRGTDHEQSGMFSYISAERRVPKDHPLHPLRGMVDAALKALGPRFDARYATSGRPSIRSGPRIGGLATPTTFRDETSHRSREDG